uniref:C2H2-type domain-containing protein n=1 Tax=Hippocampus comes TaxID=109280 RepID=A0A3Q2YGX9_HIPCM
MFLDLKLLTVNLFGFATFLNWKTQNEMNQMPTVQDNAKEQNAKKLAQEAKANPIAKMKQTKSNIPKQGIHHHASNQTGNKCTSQTVRSPPKMQAGEATQAKAATKPRSAGARHLRKNQCGECGRILSSKTALESHVSVHTGHRGLKRHSIVHRNGRLHVCQQCGKGFVYGFGLAKHVQMVHGKIKPFVCQVCNKSFFTKRDVETHIRVHTGERPFPCHLCEKKFTRSVELNAHLRWHRGEKRHWCPYCGKGFFDQNNLKRHKYIHTGEKPHSCPHCPKHFTQSGHLKNTRIKPTQARGKHANPTQEGWNWKRTLHLSSVRRTCKPVDQRVPFSLLIHIPQMQYSSEYHV